MYSRDDRSELSDSNPWWSTVKVILEKSKQDGQSFNVDCLGFLSCCCNKVPGLKHFKGEVVYFSLQLQVAVHCSRELEEGQHITFIIRTESKECMHADIQFCFPSIRFFLPLKWCYSQRMGLPSQIKEANIIPHRHYNRLTWPGLVLIDSLPNYCVTLARCRTCSPQCCNWWR